MPSKYSYRSKTKPDYSPASLNHARKDYESEDSIAHSDTGLLRGRDSTPLASELEDIPEGENDSITQALCFVCKRWRKSSSDVIKFFPLLMIIAAVISFVFILINGIALTICGLHPMSDKANSFLDTCTTGDCVYGIKGLFGPGNITISASPPAQISSNDDDPVLTDNNAAFYHSFYSYDAFEHSFPEYTIPEDEPVQSIFSHDSSILEVKDAPSIDSTI
ncbi:hypothetical protein ADUPG1_008384, partial [Aduncisulcus paluster]